MRHRGNASPGSRGIDSASLADKAQIATLDPIQRQSVIFAIQQDDLARRRYVLILPQV